MTLNGKEKKIAMCYCSKCLGKGHTSRNCENDPAPKEELALFRSRRIRKYKLGKNGYSKNRMKAQ
jgi:hypothetical protein